LEKAFEIYPDVRIVMLVHLYGTPAKMDEIREICARHNALIVEDAAESFGASYKGQQTGSFGIPAGVLSANGNKIITGSCGGMLLTDDEEIANKVRKWSTQSREDAPWYQHEELGYNYRMSNVIAGVIRGQLPYLEEHISQKKEIYYRYKEGLKDLPVDMNPFLPCTDPNFWLSCITIRPEAMARQVRGDREVLYEKEKGKTTPSEILDMLASYNAEGRPIWKPMHLQPIYQMHPYITATGNGRARSNAYIREGEISDVGSDIFQRGLCLPSDNKMTPEEQDDVIRIIHKCFD
ncbi:MAG: DegT/DnrJ/EryC1/StrS family aminotransferase, partial [Eubacterium sp.]|nr:DegT/DnrJ/EryC1/StrS family aminotransferase [Eubacterium sp.]